MCRTPIVFFPLKNQTDSTKFQGSAVSLKFGIYELFLAISTRFFHTVLEHKIDLDPGKLLDMPIPLQWEPNVENFTQLMKGKSES